MCHRLCWRTGVTTLKRDDSFIRKFVPHVTDIHKNGMQWLCHTCKRHIKQGHMPPQAVANNLSILHVNGLQPLNDLESHLISPTIPFMKVVSLPKGCQRGIHGPVVCVPSDVHKATQILPRSVDHNSVIKVKLKRKLSYSGHYLYHQVDPLKLRAWLNYLKTHHPGYIGKNYDENKHPIIQH